MKKTTKALTISTAFLAAAFSGITHANCYGSSSYYTCNDYKSGNRHTVSKYGGTTDVRSTNSQTGSSWSQKSTTYGDTTTTRGTDSQGRSWSARQTPYGSSHTDGSGKTTNCNSSGYCY
jgi:hypothetical protein